MDSIKQSPLDAPKPKKCHMAKMIRSDGAVSPLCAQVPKKINLAKESWTNRKNAVTCKRCLDTLARMAEGGAV